MWQPCFFTQRYKFPALAFVICIKIDFLARTEKEAFELIKYKIVKAVRNILTEAIVRQENPRTLATEMARQVIYRAMLLRKVQSMLQERPLKDVIIYQCSGIN
jgi:hypothetical protein